jgi:hypothetical protein
MKTAIATAVCAVILMTGGLRRAAACSAECVNIIVQGLSTDCDDVLRASC